eukprot:4514260-Prymnesium_polylepis.1
MRPMQPKATARMPSNMEHAEVESRATRKPSDMSTRCDWTPVKMRPMAPMYARASPTSTNRIARKRMRP